VGRRRMTIRNTSVYPYQDELIVELTGEDRDGDVVVISYQFTYLGSTGAVTPKQPVDDKYHDFVAQALTDHGYRIE
jgi:hypothetical protein